mgnify:FL=1
MFGDSLLSKVVVINGGIYLIMGKHFIYGICPVCPLGMELFGTVPLFRNRILSVISAALVVRINPLIFSFLCSKWSQIYFLFPGFIVVLLFPPLFLGCFKFRISKAFFLPAFYTEILVFGFILSCTIFIQWLDSKKNMCIGIVVISTVDRKISTHPHIYKVLLNKILKKINHLSLAVEKIISFKR